MIKCIKHRWVEAVDDARCNIVQLFHSRHLRRPDDSHGANVLLPILACLRVRMFFSVARSTANCVCSRKTQSVAQRGVAEENEAADDMC